jgi:hypothetical protein
MINYFFERKTPKSAELAESGPISQVKAESTDSKPDTKQFGAGQVTCL